MDVYESEIHQVLVKLLDGKHKFLNFETPSISVTALKQRIESLTSIPAHLQLLLSDSSRVLHDHQTLTPTQFHENIPFTETLDSNCRSQFENVGGRFDRKFPIVVNLLLRLRGGKGGFGSLLRGAATKAGQKKTNNFDACRDMSGRRLRHVNAEKKLEEWRAEADERKLEKMAEEFIKKKAKEAAKSGKSKGGDGTEKYVAKYREDSAKCMEEVERSVRESIKGFGSSKRKNLPEESKSDSKRLRIWLGKRKVGDSDSEDVDEEDSDEDGSGQNEKSVIIDNGNRQDSSQEVDESSGSVTDAKLGMESVQGGSSESGSEEEGTIANESAKFNEKLDVHSDDRKGKRSNVPVVESPENIEHKVIETEVSDKSVLFKLEETASPQHGVSSSVEEIASASAAEARNCVVSEPVSKESAVSGVNVQESNKPLNFDDYHSAAELEVLGLDRLKSELQARGLKCGGSLQERAARLFLLKTTPLEKLPKKLFAKK